MAARSAFSRIAPAITNARSAPSLAARRAAVIRGYASQSEQHSVGLEYSKNGVEFNPRYSTIDDSP